MPLTILYARRSRRLLLPQLNVEELFRDPSARFVAFGWGPKIASWHERFSGARPIGEADEWSPWKPFRRRALETASKWMLEHFERSDGLGAIYPAMMNAVFALLALGVLRRTRSQLGPLMGLQHWKSRKPTRSVCSRAYRRVRDTAIAMVALEEAGVPPDHPALVRAADWLLDRQIFAPGDWQQNNSSIQAGGWAFEFRNDFYPDLDDTAFVLLALAGVAHPDRDRMTHATDRVPRLAHCDAES